MRLLATSKKNSLGYCGLLALTIVLATMPAVAREAAFLDPGATIGAGEDAIKVEPKADIDTGESILNVVRRISVFFVNQTNQPIQVEKVTVNSDGNVAAELAADDCSKQGAIPGQSRCSVEVAVTPSTPGPWSVDLLMTHSGSGRIARAKLSGKTSGSAASSDKKDNGLALSAKDNAPVSFGDVDVGSKVVRSALMVNDSPEAITLYAIDVIEADNGLQRLDQGCAIDMELKPGESCPVTLVWTPVNNGQVSTDLIIRHSGRLGFAVIPIRGTAKGGTAAKEGPGTKTYSGAGSVKSGLPSPPGAIDLAKEVAGKIPAMSADALGMPSNTASVASGGSVIRLIGTVGNRAVLLTPGGDTAVVDVGQNFDIGDRTAKLASLTAKSAVIMLDGKRKELILAAAPELTSRAMNYSSNESKPGSTTGKDNQLSNSASGATGTVSASTNTAPLPGGLK